MKLDTCLSEASKRLGALEDNWDDEGAQKVDEQIIKEAIDFIRCLDGLFQNKIPIPRINPVPDGSIDIHWKLDLCECLLNIVIQDKEPMADFYWDDYNGQHIKGKVKLSLVEKQMTEKMGEK